MHLDFLKWKMILLYILIKWSDTTVLEIADQHKETHEQGGKAGTGESWERGQREVPGAFSCETEKGASSFSFYYKKSPNILMNSRLRMLLFK